MTAPGRQRRRDRWHDAGGDLPRELAGIGQTGGMDDAEQRHFAGLDRQGGARDFLMPLEHQLPQSMERRKGQQPRPALIGIAFLRRLRGIGIPTQLRQGHGMHRLKQAAQH